MHEVGEAGDGADFAAFVVDDADTVVAGGGDDLVGRADELHGGDLLGPALDLFLPLAEDHVPRDHDAVSAAGGEDAAVGAEGDAHDVVGVTLEQVHLLARGDLGDAGDLVGGAGSEALSVGREVEAHDDVAMALLPRRGGFAGGGVKEGQVSAARGFTPAGGEEFAIGTEFHGVDAVGKKLRLFLAAESALEHPAHAGSGDAGLAVGRGRGKGTILPRGEGGVRSGGPGLVLDRSARGDGPNGEASVVEDGGGAPAIGGKGHGDGLRGGFGQAGLGRGEGGGGFVLRLLRGGDRGVGGSDGLSVFRLGVVDAFHLGFGIDDVALRRGDGGEGRGLGHGEGREFFLSVLERFLEGGVGLAAGSGLDLGEDLVDGLLAHAFRVLGGLHRLFLFGQDFFHRDDGFLRLFQQFIEGFVLRLDAGDLGFLEGLLEGLAGDGPVMGGHFLRQGGAAAEVRERLGGGDVPDADGAIGATGDKHLAVGGEEVIHDRDLAGLGDLLEQGLIGGLGRGGGGRVRGDDFAFPEFHLAEAAAGEAHAVRAERERLDHGAVGAAFFGRIVDLGDKFPRCEIVEVKPVAAAADGETPVFRQGDAVDWIDPGREGLEGNLALGLRTRLGPLVDPGLEHGDLGIGQLHRPRLVVRWRHLEIGRMDRGLDEEALGAFAGDDGGTGIAALDHELGRLHVEPGLRGGLVVAGNAVRLEEGIDVLIELGLFDGKGRSDAGGKDEESSLKNAQNSGKTVRHFCAVVAGAAGAGAGAAFGFTETRMGAET